MKTFRPWFLNQLDLRVQTWIACAPGLQRGGVWLKSHSEPLFDPSHNVRAKSWTGWPANSSCHLSSFSSVTTSIMPWNILPAPRAGWCKHFDLQWPSTLQISQEWVNMQSLPYLHLPSKRLYLGMVLVRLVSSLATHLLGWEGRGFPAMPLGSLGFTSAPCLLGLVWDLQVPLACPGFNTARACLGWPLCLGFTLLNWVSQCRLLVWASCWGPCTPGSPYCWALADLKLFACEFPLEFSHLHAGWRGDCQCVATSPYCHCWSSVQLLP